MVMSTNDKPHHRPHPHVDRRNALTRADAIIAGHSVVCAEFGDDATCPGPGPEEPVALIASGLLTGWPEYEGDEETAVYLARCMRLEAEGRWKPPAPVMPQCCPFHATGGHPDDRHGRDPASIVYAGAEPRREEPLRCVWYEEADPFEGTPGGPACDAPATHISCTPYPSAATCEAHKCRCAKPIGSAEPRREEAPDLAAIEARAERADRDDLVDVCVRLRNADEHGYDSDADRIEEVAASAADVPILHRRGQKRGAHDATQMVKRVVASAFAGKEPPQ